MAAATLTRLEAIASDPHYRGLCLDFENDGAGDREALSSFVATLARNLHTHHRRLSVAIDGVSHEDATISTGFYDDRALSAAADTVFVMAWGAHWAGSTPGPIAPLDNVQAVSRYVASLPNASRFVLGAPMYGLDWPNEGGPANQATAYQYSGVLALARAVGATPLRDPASGEMTFRYTTAAGVTHQVWYLDARAVADILQTGRANGLAVGLWRLGREDQRLWSSPTVSR
jgi:spore germination protein